ncbi:hypothetical protein CYMTET_54854, partial [Cymbomonas tetramitiformis]
SGFEMRAAAERDERPAERSGDFAAQSGLRDESGRRRESGLCEMSVAEKESRLSRDSESLYRQRGGEWGFLPMKSGFRDERLQGEAASEIRRPAEEVSGAFAAESGFRDENGRRGEWALPQKERLQRWSGRRAFVASLREELDAYGINNGELLLALDETTLPRQLPMLALPRWTAHAILLGRRLSDIKSLPGPHKMFESRRVALEVEGARRADSITGSANLGAKEATKRALSTGTIPERPGATEPGESPMKMIGSSQSFHMASKPRRAAPTTARRTSCPDISKMIPEEAPPPLKRANTVQLTNTKPAAEVRPRAVISYSICQQDFMNFISGLLKEWGFDPWSGADVLGGGNWAQQWIEMAEDKNTKLIVYILSRSFTLSPNCQTEFQFIMQDSKRAIVVPLMYEKFQLPKTFAFFLTTHNYVVVTPDIDTICQCPGKCQCDKDAREVQSQPPDTKWHFTFQRTIKFATGLTPWKRKEGASLTTSRSMNPHRSIQFRPFRESRRGNSDDAAGDSEPVARLVSNKSQVSAVVSPAAETPVASTSGRPRVRAACDAPA